MSDAEELAELKRHFFPNYDPDAVEEGAVLREAKKLTGAVPTSVRVVLHLRLPVGEVEEMKRTIQEDWGLEDMLDESAEDPIRVELWEW